MEKNTIETIRAKLDGMQALTPLIQAIVRTEGLEDQKKVEKASAVIFATHTQILELLREIFEVNDPQDGVLTALLGNAAAKIVENGWQGVDSGTIIPEVVASMIQRFMLVAPKAVETQSSGKLGERLVELQTFFWVNAVLDDHKNLVNLLWSSVDPEQATTEFVQHLQAKAWEVVDSAVTVGLECEPQQRSAAYQCVFEQLSRVGREMLTHEAVAFRQHLHHTMSDAEKQRFVLSTKGLHPGKLYKKVVKKLNAVVDILCEHREIMNSNKNQARDEADDDGRSSPES